MQGGEKGLRGTLEIYNFISSYLLLTQRDPISIHRQRDSREDALWSSRWSIKGEKLKEGKCWPQPPICISACTFQSAGRLHLLGGQACDWMADLGHENESFWLRQVARRIPDVHVLGIQIGEMWGGEEWVWVDGGPSQWSGRNTSYVASTGTHTYTHTSDHTHTQSLSANFMNSSFSWICLSKHYERGHLTHMQHYSLTEGHSFINRQICSRLTPSPLLCSYRDLSLCQAPKF